METVFVVNSLEKLYLFDNLYPITAKQGMNMIRFINSIGIEQAVSCKNRYDTASGGIGGSIHG